MAAEVDQMKDYGPDRHADARDREREKRRNAHLLRGKRFGFHTMEMRNVIAGKKAVPGV
jgi:hypothetical protein